MMFKRYAACLVAAGCILALASCNVEPHALSPATPVAVEDAPAGQLPNGVAPTAYRLDIATDPDADGFSGTIEIDVHLDTSTNRIWLHALGPVVSSAKAVLADRTVIPATFTGDQSPDGVSRLDFQSTLPAGDATLVMTYSAPYNLNLAGLYKAEQSGKSYLASQMEPIDARRMFPGFDEPRFKAPWTLTVTVPQGLKVVANGAETSATPAGNGMVRHEFATTRPIQSYLVALAVGPYDQVDAAPIPATATRAEPVPLRAFAAAGKGEALREALGKTDEFILWQESYFDYPYPYGKLDLIAAAEFAYGAMENAGAIVYREAALLIDDRTTFGRRRGIFTTHAHELGHQWFGNLVTPAWWDDIWLNEAFATWISYKTLNATDPDGSWELAPIKAGLTAMPADSLMSARQIRNPILKTGDIKDAFDSITYRKGGSVLNMFETYLGEAAFRDGIRLHMRRFEDGVATADDFLQSLADGSKQPDVVPSFRSFLMQPGIPFLNVELSCPAADAGLLRVTQSRYAPLGSQIDTEGSLWEIPFAAHVKGTSGERTIRRMLTDRTTEIALPGDCPDWVMPNAGGAGYWRFTLDPKTADALNRDFASLPTGEQIMLADSTVAGFQAGALHTDEMLAALEASAGGAPDAVSVPFGIIPAIRSTLDDAGQAQLSAWVETTYAPLYRRLSTQPATALGDSERLLLPELHTMLLQNGQRTDERRDMAARAREFLGIGQEADTAALAPEDLPISIDIGVREDGQAFFDGALAFVRGSTNQTERASILQGLARSGTAAQASGLLALMLDPEFSGNELYAVYLSALSNEAARPDVWKTLLENFPAIVRKVPTIRQPQLAGAAASFCDSEGITNAEAFFNAQASLTPGYERSLAQGLERARNCAAFRQSKGSDIADVFAQ